MTPEVVGQIRLLRDLDGTYAPRRVDPAGVAARRLAGLPLWGMICWEVPLIDSRIRAVRCAGGWLARRVMRFPRQDREIRMASFTAHVELVGTLLPLVVDPAGTLMAETHDPQAELRRVGEAVRTAGVLAPELRVACADVLGHVAVVVNRPVTSWTPEECAALYAAGQAAAAATATAAGSIDLWRATTVD